MPKPIGYKYCGVPRCENTTFTAPEKLFLLMPKAPKQRKLWIDAARRQPVSVNTLLYYCEDHFEVEKCVQNYMKVKLMEGTPVSVTKDAMPTKFSCQEQEGQPSHQQLLDGELSASSGADDVAMVPEPRVTSCNSSKRETLKSCNNDVGYLSQTTIHDRPRLMTDSSTQTTCNSKKCTERKKRAAAVKKKREEAIKNRKLWERPELNYRELITLALINGPSEGLTFEGINKFIIELFPYFKDGKCCVVLRNTLKAHFVEFPPANGSTSGDCSLWRLKADDVIPVKMELLNKLAKLRSPLGMAHPELMELVFRGQLFSQGDPDPVPEKLVKKSIKINAHSAKAKPVRRTKPAGAVQPFSSGTTSRYDKPPISTKMLILLALINSPDEEQYLPGIRSFIRQMFPFYKDNHAWKNNISCSLRKHFVRETTKRKQGLWRVKDSEECNLNDLRRLHRERIMATMKSPEQFDRMLEGQALWKDRYNKLAEHDSAKEEADDRPTPEQV